MKRFISVFIIVSFLSTSMTPMSVRAQMLPLPEVGASVPLSAALTPAHLKGLVIDIKNPFVFDFIFHKGSNTLSAEEKKIQYTALVKYFLTALTVPDADQWVNLSPYENNRIIAENFGQTEMGRDLLAQDYLLKQMMATLSNPESDLGQAFWARVYQQAQQRFGTTNIPTNLFNKVWISPESVDLYEKDNTVYIINQRLKVQLESDYLAMKDSNTVVDDAYSILTKEVMREVILPALEKEVNEGRTFARLRQIYSGMLLAAWYKNALQESLLVKMYGDQSKINGVQQDPANNQRIYDQYIASFKKGVVNLIKEEIDPFSDEIIPRKYFSGGVVGFDKAMSNPAIVARHTDMVAVSASDVAQMEVGHVDVLSAASAQDVTDSDATQVVPQRQRGLINVIYDAQKVRKVITTNDNEILIAETDDRVYLFYAEKQVTISRVERYFQKYTYFELPDIENVILSEDEQSLLVYNKDRIAVLRHVRPSFGSYKGSSVNVWESVVYDRPANAAFFLRMPWFDEKGNLRLVYQESDTNETAFLSKTFQGQVLESNKLNLSQIAVELNSHEEQTGALMDAAQESGMPTADDFQAEMSAFDVQGWTPIDDGSQDFRPSDYEVRGPGWYIKGKPTRIQRTGRIGRNLSPEENIIYVATSDLKEGSVPSAVMIGKNFATVHYMDQSHQGVLTPKILENRLRNIKGVILDKRGQAFAIYNASQLVVFYVPKDGSLKNKWCLHLWGFPADFDVIDATSAFETNGTAFLFKYRNKEGRPMEQRFDLSSPPVLPLDNRLFQRFDKAQKSEKVKPEHWVLQWQRIYKYDYMDALKHKMRVQLNRVGKVLQVLVSRNAHNLVIVGENKTVLNYLERRSEEGITPEESFSREKEQTLVVDIKNTIDAEFNKQGTAFLIYNKKAMFLFRRIYINDERTAVKNRWVVQRIPFLVPLKQMTQKPEFSKDGRIVHYSYVKSRKAIRRLSLSFNEDSGGLSDIEIDSFNQTHVDDQADLAQQYGGIDFARENLHMNIRRDGNGVPLPAGQQDLETLRIDGLVPVLGDIRPAISLALFAAK